MNVIKAVKKVIVASLKLIKKCVGKVKRFLAIFIMYYKDGGITYAQISQIHSGSLLKDKRILVTGGSSGIGLAIAKKAISEGAKVVITGRNINKLKKAKQEINNDNLHIIEWDHSDFSNSNIDNKINQVFLILGGSLDALVNNAGILLDQRFPDTSEEVWDKTYAVNSKAVFFLSQTVAKQWLANKTKGKILNISSTSGFYGSVIPYGMTKWDIAGFTEGLGKKLAPAGIIVNGIAPGRTATSMLGKDKDSNIYDSYTSAKRYGMPEEIAELTVFMLSGASNFIVGQTIVVDGGYTL